MELIDTIFCDDIRFEANNKISLMGLYSDRIIFRVSHIPDVSWPIPMRLSVFLRFALEPKEKIPNKFEFEYFSNGKSIIKLNGIFPEDKIHSYAQLALTAEGILLEPDYLGFTIKIFEGDNLLLVKDNMKAIKILKE